MKEALSLSQAGHLVTVLGAWLDPTFKARDQRLIETVPFKFVPVVDVTRGDVAERLRHLCRRISTKIGNLRHQLTGWDSVVQLGFDVSRLLDVALNCDADLYIAHTEFGLYPASQLLRRGYRVAVDMEDWYSEDLLPEARRKRPLCLLRNLESELLGAGSSYASCPSEAMSEALSVTYDCKPPLVIYNSFPLVERQTIDGLHKDRRDGCVPSICWYSQTIGRGRGLEDLFAALPLLNCKVEVHLRGRAASGTEEWIVQSIPKDWQNRVFVHPLVSNDELLSRVAEHDIGFAGEMKYCRSRDLTVTNKMLHYLLGGLAVVASDTSGQLEIATRAGAAVEIYQSGDPSTLAKAINSFLGSPCRLARAKAASLQAAKQIFCWEKQERIFLDTVAAALSQPSGNFGSRTV